jgi:2-oxoglutarate dehydrogenase E2 component (dihydrolipoamide succinyltransferase)
MQMSNKVDIHLPKLGESIVGARVVKWLKEVGDFITLDEPLLEVATDKVNSEIPSPYAGVLEEILVQENEEVAVGDPLARIAIKDFVEKREKAGQLKEEQEEEFKEEKKNHFLSPGVLREAEKEGVTIETLKKISGTGEGGRVTKKDVEKFAKGCPKKADSALEERVKMSQMRKLIAENMVRSFYEAPHASLVTEVDVTEVMSIIKKEKERFLETHKVKLTITSFLVHALSKALELHPMLNASLEDETIVMKRYINVGIAVNVDTGLIVPVIKNCQEKSLVSIAKSVSDLAGKARTHKLSPDEVSEGTITLTNFGMTKALIGIPIIRYPEVAIIGAGTIQKRVVIRSSCH